MSNNPGVGSNVISTPKGGGAVSGMGEKFSPDLFTGTGNFSVPIALPPGRNGFQPDITLVYSTGNGNSPFGLGWSLSLPGVTRKTSKGIPIYDDEKDVFILSGAEDLIPISFPEAVPFSYPEGVPPDPSVQRYRPRTEGLFARIDRFKDATNDYWKVWSKDGLISYYGTPESANTVTEYKDGAVCADPEYRSKVFHWLLSKTVDVFGNQIQYSYIRDNNPTIQQSNNSATRNWDQLYLSEIKYADYVDGSETKFLCSVKFHYEERPDPFSSYSAGFEIRTTKRCTKIEVYTHPSDTDVLTKTYHFHYLDGRVGAGEISSDFLPVNGVSLLSQVKIQGHDGEETEWMPPLEFSYSKFEPKKRDFYPIGGKNLPGVSLASPDHELADMFGNGLPDIIQMNGVARYWKNLGNGTYDLPREMKNAPAGVELADPEVSMMDAQGDGKIDLVVTKQGLAGYFPMNHDGLWDKKSFRKYKNIPSFSLADPEVIRMDLDGDGITDVLRNGSSLECFFNDPVEGFYKTVRVQKKKLNGFPNVSFADPRIRTAGMSGSGLQDIIMIHSGSIEYWPNMGHGKWGGRVTMKNSPKLPYQYDPARVLIGDIDGDGLSDVVYVENNKLTLWINQSGNGFSDPIVLTGTPPVHNMAAVRIADMLGTGVSGIVWSYDYDGTQRDRMFYFDFTGGVKPYLLHEMNNNMGAITRVEYTPSTNYFIEDNKRPETRWKTTLPFPVLVVSKVEVIDEISGGKLSTEYSYHHGYYDGGEREFRGFGRVEQKDTETFERYNRTSLQAERSNLPSPSGEGPGVRFNTVEKLHYTPPTLTKSWFHLGPIGDEFGEWNEVDFTNEYWNEDPQVLQRPAEMVNMIKALPRRARRDAYRTLRGSILRTELYALDGTAIQDRPYTVSENLQGVRLEYTPITNDQLPMTSPDANNKAGSGYIFFSHGLASRTTQWERGEDPMIQFSFTEDYDDYGIPKKQIGIAVPRGRSPLAGSGTAPYLATYAESDFVHKDEEGHYLIGRAISARSYEVVNDGNMTVFQLKDRIMNNLPPSGGSGISYVLLSHSVTYYDGTAFTGLAHGVLGDYGVPVRTETLVMTDAQVTAIYGDNRPPYILADETPDTPSWTADYPTAFQSSVPTNAGYLYKEGDSVYEEGYYVIADRKKFDFHDNPSTAKGLVLEMKDPLDHTASVEYDSYNMLPVKVTDPIGMETIATYDYRVMQASQITDPNLNRVQFAFSPLGFLFKSAVMGKSTDDPQVGDTLEDPGTFMEYDFFAWMNDQNPVFVKTTVREFHINDPDDNGNTIVSIQYSDGFGRLIQTRTQCEEVIFGDAVFGDSGLLLDQTQSADAVGVENEDAENINVIVSGWQVYNNKGQVVEKYEPYYDKGFEYAPPFSPLPSGEGAGGEVALDALTRGKKVQMFYDPRGQVIRTKNPDNTEQRVIFGIPVALSNPNIFTPTPWESYTYDANDLRDFTHYGDASVPNEHIHTPASSLIDPLGRTIKTIDRLTSSTNESEQVVMQYEFDIRGNLLTVTDALGHTTFEHHYDLANRPLKTTHIDGGDKYVFMNCMNMPIELRDAKGALVLNEYDILNRPTKVWARDKSGETVGVRQRTIYGDDSVNAPADPEDYNLKGKPYKVYDEAGLTQIDAYDFKGNVPEKIRKVISDTEILTAFDGPPTDWEVPAYRVDWNTSTDSILDSVEYKTSMTYDALNRIKQMIYPEDVDEERKILIPEYNKAGALTSVKLKDTEEGDEIPYVDRIAYNARGQRLLAAFGNGVMTRYRYDENNFRLTRMKTEKYTKDGLTYEPNSGVRQNLAYTYDLSGNIIEINNKTTDCGIAGADELTREFSYDPLYRLLSATGREKDTLMPDPWYDTYQPDNPDLTRGYTQNYEYDKLGNIQELQHIATGGNFTRTFNYVSNKNKLDNIEIGESTYSFIHDVNGNITSDDDGGSRFYEYDYADRIRSFRVQAGTSEPSQYAHYLYDGGGNRVKKIVRKQGGGYKTTVYIDGVFEYHKASSYADEIPDLEIGSWTIGSDNDGEYNTLHIMDDQSRIATRRIGDDSGAISGDATPAIKYNIEDHLGSSSLHLETNGTLVNFEEYYPFGETSFGSYAKKRYRFCGKEKDEESGLYYYGMRYYSAWTCRFMSVDPLAGKFAHLTPYQYASNRPIKDVDLDGMENKNEKSSVTNTDNGVEHTDNVNKNSNATSESEHKEGEHVPNYDWSEKDIGKEYTKDGVKVRITGIRKERYNYYEGTNKNEGGKKERFYSNRGIGTHKIKGNTNVYNLSGIVGGDKRIKGTKYNKEIELTVLSDERNVAITRPVAEIEAEERQKQLEMEKQQEAKKKELLAIANNTIGSIGNVSGSLELGVDKWVANRPGNLLNGSGKLHPSFMNLSDKNPTLANRFLSGDKTVKLLKSSRVLGVTTGIIGIGFSVNKIASGEGTAWDWVDIGVNSVGLLATGATYAGLISNPVGWAIGAGVLAYNAYRLWDTW